MFKANWRSLILAGGIACLTATNSHAVTVKTTEVKVTAAECIGAFKKAGVLPQDWGIVYFNGKAIYVQMSKGSLKCTGFKLG